MKLLTSHLVPHQPWWGLACMNKSLSVVVVVTAARLMLGSAMMTVAIATIAIIATVSLTVMMMSDFDRVVSVVCII